MAGTIPQTFIDDLLERVDIVEVIDSRVKLKKTGKNYSACCPFHEEKTPSFTVSPDKQFYYCFGCGASGNSVGFIMDYERLSFPEAIDQLAKTAGVDVPREQHKDPQKRAHEADKEKARKTLYELMETANSYYQQQLRQHPEKAKAVNYLKGRGLSGHIAKDFGIGYAPPGWDNLHKQLATSNEAQDLLLEGCMLIRNEDKDSLYDRFRDRIMFPIRDTRGRVIGFGGRVLTDEKPKYLNSPETPIFHKGKELYGLYEARQAYRQLPRLLVVEGYMDVVALAQFTIRYGVATLGTACGEDHLNRAFRFTNEVVFCFDGDEAGRKATRRAMENSLPTMQDGRQIKFLYLPEGEDPDTLVRQIGAEKFTRLIEGAPPLEQFLFEEMSRDINIDTMEGRARLCKMTIPLLDQLPKGVYRELMFQQLANRTQLSRDALNNLLEETDSKHIQTPETKHKKEKPRYTPPKTTSVSTPAPPVVDQQRLQERAITLLLFQPGMSQHIPTIDELRHNAQGNIALLVKLIDLLQHRPEFSSGQILGHWQGSHGAEESDKLKEMLAKASLFQRARELKNDEETGIFDPQQEFIDTLNTLISHQQTINYNSIIEQLNHKPANTWSDAERQLYRKAINARAKL